MAILCFECGDPASEDHHVVPVFRGGKRTVPLCARCHALVHDKGVLNKILTREALAQKKERGEFLGRPPFGWKLDRNTGALVEAPEQQASLRRAKELFEQGLSFRETEVQIKAEGLCHISRGSLHRIKNGTHKSATNMQYNPPTRTARPKKVNAYRDIVALGEMTAFMEGLPKDTRVRIVRYLADSVLPKASSAAAE